MSAHAKCIITAKAVSNGRYYWAWRSVDGSHRSRCDFTYFFECLSDARAKGFDIQVEDVVADLKSANRLRVLRPAGPLKRAAA